MKYQNYPVECYDNLKQMLKASAKKYGEKTLFMQKENGAYRHYSYADYWADVNGLGTVLLGMDLRGKQILLIGENCYAWVTAYMAVTCGVGTVVPLDAELSAEEIARIAAISGAEAVIFSDSLLPKLSKLGEQVKKIPFSSLPKYTALGKKQIKSGDHVYLRANPEPREMCAMLFPSGVTGEMRGVMLSHHNLCFNLSEVCRMVYIDERDVFLSVLPLHHVYECTCGFLCQVYRGCTVAFSEGLKFLGKNMKEVHPTVMNCVPSMLDGMHQRVWAHIRGIGAEEKVRRMIDVTNAIPNPKLRMTAKKRAFSAIHRSFGGSLRLLITGGASASPDVLKGFRDLGILALQGYGMTECSPVVALNRDTCYRDDSAGIPTPNGLLDIADMQDDGVGEIRYRGDSVMLGYYGMPELTREVIHDGWYYTGDMGYLDSDGFLHITGRKRNVIRRTDGKTVFPEELELALCRSAFVAEAVVVGYSDPRGGEPHIVALLHADFRHVHEVFGKDVTQAQLENALRRAVAEANGSLPDYKRIETFLIREQEFPKTATRKIRRAGLAEAAYAEYRNKMTGNH